MRHALNVILCVFRENMKDGELPFIIISFVERTKNDVQDDVMRDAKWP